MQRWVAEAKEEEAHRLAHSAGHLPLVLVMATTMEMASAEAGPGGSGGGGGSSPPPPLPHPLYPPSPPSHSDLVMAATVKMVDA